MMLQRFETIPESKRLVLMVDMLRYENAAQGSQIQALEKEIAGLQAQMEKARQDLEALQRVLDLQNAEWFAAAQKS